MKTRIRILAVVTLLTPLAVASTPPAPPAPGPWYQFALSGFVKSASDASVANYTVATMGKIDGAWRLIHSCPVSIADDYGGTDDISLTDRFGRFSLSSWSCAPAESIAAAIVLPDTILLGTPIDRRSLSYQEYDGLYEVKEDGFFCDHTDTRQRIQGYQYFLDSLIVTVP